GAVDGAPTPSEAFTPRLPRTMPPAPRAVLPSRGFTPRTRAHPFHLLPELDCGRAPFRFLGHSAIHRTLFVRAVFGGSAAVILPIAMFTLSPRVAEAVTVSGSVAVPREVGR
ncbi:MAG: hypothetical protein WEC54_08595, partial [Gemmatimonadales bacterium]